MFYGAQNSAETVGIIICTGARQALQLFAALYRRLPAATLEALSWVLTPDADQGIGARVEAVEGICKCQSLLQRYYETMLTPMPPKVTASLPARKAMSQFVHQLKRHGACSIKW